MPSHPGGRRRGRRPGRPRLHRNPPRLARRRLRRPPRLVPRPASTPPSTSPPPTTIAAATTGASPASPPWPPRTASPSSPPATSSSTTPSRRRLHDVLTCIRERCAIDAAGRRLQANAERHLKPPLELARLFRDHPGALANTVEIAERCRFSLAELRYEYPDEVAADGRTPRETLAALTWAGAAERYPDGIPPKVRATIEHELALIAQLDYEPYFLTVEDIVRKARELGILCQGRGSAANSAVCYCLGVTSVDPARIDLLFERFISAERDEVPDIDVDFEHERREEVIQYIYGKYGRDRAGLTATVITYRVKSALRDVGRAMGLSEDVTGRLLSMVSWRSKPVDGDRAREEGFDPGDRRLALTLELARELQGFPRHLSQHTGGFVISRGPLCEIVPIENAAMEDRTVIEWNKDDLEVLGMVKVDVLGLGMLSCIRRAFALVREHCGVAHTLESVPREDPDTYAMIRRADTVGVFQIESRAQMAMLPRLRPATFYDPRDRGGDRAPGTDPGATWSTPTCGGGRGARRWSIRPRNCGRCSARRSACRCFRSRSCGLRSSRRGSRRPRPTGCGGPWPVSGIPAPSTPSGTSSSRG